VCFFVVVKVNRGKRVRGGKWACAVQKKVAGENEVVWGGVVIWECGGVKVVCCAGVGGDDDDVVLFLVSRMEAFR
jgi:hypothetical protein